MMGEIQKRFWHFVGSVGVLLENFWTEKKTSGDAVHGRQSSRH
jgi:hypothetical protein